MKLSYQRRAVYVTALLLTALLTACGSKKETIVIEEDSTTALTAQNAEEAPPMAGAAQEETTPVLYVHVCGAVKSEGVYALLEGARIGDAVALAGGITDKADTAAINLALRVTDGMKVYVPCTEETSGIPKVSFAAERFDGTASPTSAGSNKININTAPVSELMCLSGIGERYAQAIVDYRESSGGFAAIEDIKKVHGIGDKTFERIKDQIIV